MTEKRYTLADKLRSYIARYGINDLNASEKSRFIY